MPRRNRLLPQLLAVQRAVPPGKPPFPAPRRPRRPATSASGENAAVTITAYNPTASLLGGCSPPSNLQNAINAAASGSTVNGCGGSYSGTITINKPLTLANCTITGGNPGIRVSSSDVRIQNVEVTGATNPAQYGAIDSLGYSRVTVSNCNIHHNGGAGVNFRDGSDITVEDSILAFNAQQGFTGERVTRYYLDRNEIYSNNPNNAYSPGWEAGGGKIKYSPSGRFDGNSVHDNKGPGLWLDIDNTNWIVRNNRVYNHRNQAGGIFFEISQGCQIYNNVVYNNGMFTNWGYGAGIFISSSRGAEVYGNVCAWNGKGITVISQTVPVHGDHKWDDVSNNYVHDNSVIQMSGSSSGWTSGSDYYGLGWLHDWSSAMFTTGANNRGAGNDYWFSGAQKYAWNGQHTTIAAFNATLGEEGGVLITTGAKDAILATVRTDPATGATYTIPASQP